MVVVGRSFTFKVQYVQSFEEQLFEQDVKI